MFFLFCSAKKKKGKNEEEEVEEEEEYKSNVLRSKKLRELVKRRIYYCEQFYTNQ